MCEERVVLVEEFAEAEAGVEHDLAARDACGGCGCETVGEFGKDEGKGPRAARSVGDSAIRGGGRVCASGSIRSLVGRRWWTYPGPRGGR